MEQDIVLDWFGGQSGLVELHFQEVNEKYLKPFTVDELV